MGRLFSMEELRRLTLLRKTARGIIERNYGSSCRIELYKNRINDCDNIDKLREYIEEERSESIVSDIMKNFADELASIYGEDAEITKMARGEIEDNKWMEREISYEEGSCEDLIANIDSEQADAIIALYMLQNEGSDYYNEDKDDGYFDSHDEEALDECINDDTEYEEYSEDSYEDCADDELDLGDEEDIDDEPELDLDDYVDDEFDIEDYDTESEEDFGADNDGIYDGSLYKNEIEQLNKNNIEDYGTCCLAVGINNNSNELNGYMLGYSVENVEVEEQHLKNTELQSKINNCAVVDNQNGSQGFFGGDFSLGSCGEFNKEIISVGDEYDEDNCSDDELDLGDEYDEDNCSDDELDLGDEYDEDELDLGDNYSEDDLDLGDDSDDELDIGDNYDDYEDDSYGNLELCDAEEFDEEDGLELDNENDLDLGDDSEFDENDLDLGDDSEFDENDLDLGDELNDSENSEQKNLYGDNPLGSILGMQSNSNRDSNVNSMNIVEDNDSDIQNNSSSQKNNNGEIFTDIKANKILNTAGNIGNSLFGAAKHIKNALSNKDKHK